MNRHFAKLLVAALIFVCAASVEASGMDSNPITACPDSPNCVSSIDVERDSYILPIQREESAKAAIKRLKGIIEKTENATIVEANEHTIRAEFRTKLFGFVDDVVFHAEESGAEIHMRSASRVGYWDLGANRKRLEKIREAYRKAAEND
ncbi:DUF1499 domain-containing protein [Salidesulfovibrio brasiliensis]